MDEKSFSATGDVDVMTFVRVETFFQGMAL
jgi:hypothetical protein